MEEEEDEGFEFIAHAIERVHEVRACISLYKQTYSTHYIFGKQIGHV